ncbi:MAG: hypothetical protein SNF93_02255, partial [Rikenellaceae bacterium]
LSAANQCTSKVKNEVFGSKLSLVPARHERDEQVFFMRLPCDFTQGYFLTAFLTAFLTEF